MHNYKTLLVDGVAHVTVREFSILSGWTVTRIQRMCRVGNKFRVMRHVRVGNAIAIPLTELREFCDSVLDAVRNVGNKRLEEWVKYINYLHEHRLEATISRPVSISPWNTPDWPRAEISRMLFDKPLGALNKFQLDVLHAVTFDRTTNA